MASRSTTNALRTSIKQLTRSAVQQQQRSFLTSTFQASRNNALRQASKTIFSAQQTRGVKTVDFAGVEEQVFGMFLSL